MWWCRLVDSGRGEASMVAVVRLRDDYSASDLRDLACKARDGAQARRLMALAAVVDGKSRAAAAAVGLMDRQTLRDWVVRFNAEGPEGLIDRTSPGRPPKLTPAQKQELRQRTWSVSPVEGYGELT